MTKEEAIENLREYVGPFPRQATEAIWMAIEALSAEPKCPYTDEICKMCKMCDIDKAEREWAEDYEHATLVDIKEPLKKAHADGDLISRAEVMNRLEDFCKWCKDGRLQGAEFVWDCLIPNTPSADRPTDDDDIKDRQIKQLAHDVVILERQLADRPSGEWKLASEELPQSVGSYIVTCKDEQGWVYVDYDFWTVANEFKYNCSKVIAWIPFPKPNCGAKMKGGEDGMMEVIIKCSDDCRGNKKINGEPIEEIVRCKDCIHKTLTTDGEYNPDDIVCDYWMSDGLNENDYCSYGERKE